MPADDIQAAHIEWQRTQFEREKIAYEWVATNMPVECEDALRKFVEVNPHQRGIQWWDALSIMNDCDAHLDITEPLAEVMDEWISPFHTFIVYTILYASKTFATDYTVPMQVMGIRATVDNNGGVPEGLL